MNVISTTFGSRTAAKARARALAAYVLGAAVLGTWLPATVAAQRPAAPRDAAVVRAELQRLDASLAESAAELARVDERVSASRAAVREEAGAPLVVLLRADPGAAAALAGATAELGDLRGPLRRYDASGRDALRAGAADELLRTSLPPGAHAVRATVTAAGGTATRTATVTPTHGRVTYVEFTLRGRSLDAAAWVADAPAAPRP